MSDPQTLLPPNATQTERDLELVIARMVSIPVPIRSLWSVDTCPSAHLPYLAWALSVDVWDADWSDAIKRDVLREAVPVHRLKGTRASVERALGALGFKIDLTEWFEYGGETHTFRLDAFGGDVFGAGFQVDAKLLATVTRLIEHTKPARSHFELRIGESFNTDVYMRVGSLGQRKSTTAHDPDPRERQADTPVSLRVATRPLTVSQFTHDVLRREAA